MQNLLPSPGILVFEGNHSTFNREPSFREVLGKKYYKKDDTDGKMENEKMG